MHCSSDTEKQHSKIMVSFVTDQILVFYKSHFLLFAR